MLGRGDRVALGALATMMPCLVAASMSMLSTPMPARPIALSFPARSNIGGDLRGAADNEAVVIPDLLEQFFGAEIEEDVHLEVLLSNSMPGSPAFRNEDPQALTPLFEKTLWAAPTPYQALRGSRTPARAQVAAIVAMMAKASK